MTYFSRPAGWTDAALKPGATVRMPWAESMDSGQGYRVGTVLSVSPRSVTVELASGSRLNLQSLDQFEVKRT